MKKIREFGVKGNGSSDETILIQKAIDECALSKDELVFEAGTYITTSLNLRTDSVINLEEGSVIKANPDYKEWEKCTHKPLIYSLDAENVTIKGNGEVCCNGTLFRDEVGKPLWEARPHGTIVFRNTKNISLSGIKITDSVSWTVHFDDSEYAVVDGITIRNLEYQKSNCCDGIDINGCRHIEIKNCDIETGDDAICLKNIDVVNRSHKRGAMYDIYAHDCVLATTCNGFKIGTETVGDAYDIRVENIVLNRHSNCADSGYPEGMGMPLSAIDLQSNDGAIIHDITVKNFHASIAGTPLFVVLQKRRTITESSEPGKLYNISIENFKVDRSIRPCLINSCEGAYVENVTIKNMEAHNFETYNGELKAIRACGRCYPDPYNYGHFPAYGLFAYNVKNLNIDESVILVDEANSGRECVIIQNDQR